MGKVRVTVLEVAQGALGYERYTGSSFASGTPINRLGTADTRRITAIMAHLQWERGKRGGTGERFWIRGRGACAKKPGRQP